MKITGTAEFWWGGECRAVLENVTIDTNPPPTLEDIIEERFQLFKERWPYHKLWLLGERKVRQIIREAVEHRLNELKEEFGDAQHPALP